MRPDEPGGRPPSEEDAEQPDEGVPGAGDAGEREIPPPATFAGRQRAAASEESADEEELSGVDPADELEKVKHLVRNVHLKDNRGGFEDWYFPAVGDGGSVDFSRIRRILDGVGFSGPYTIEIEGIGGEPEPGLEGRQDRIARSVAHLRACGYFD